MEHCPQLEALQQQMEGTTQAQASLQAQVAGEFAMYSQKIESLEAACAKHGREMAEAHTSFSEQQKFQDGTVQLIQDEVRYVQVIARKIDRVDCKADDLSTRMAAQKREFEGAHKSLKAQLESQAATVQEIQDEVSHAQEFAKKVDSKADELSTRFQRVDCVVQKIQDEVGQVQEIARKVDRVDCKADDLSTRVAAQKEEFEGAHTSLKAQLESQADTVQEIQDEVSHAQEFAKKVDSKADELSTRFQRVDGVVQKIQDEVCQVQEIARKVDRVDCKADDLSTRVAAQKEEFEGAHTSLKAQLESQADTVQEIQDEVSHAQEFAKKVDSKADELSTRFQRVDCVVQKIQDEVCQVRKIARKVDRVDCKADDLSTRVAAQKEEFEGAHNSLKAQLESQGVTVQEIQDEVSHAQEFAKKVDSKADELSTRFQRVDGVVQKIQDEVCQVQEIARKVDRVDCKADDLSTRVAAQKEEFEGAHNSLKAQLESQYIKAQKIEDDMDHIWMAVEKFQVAWHQSDQVAKELEAAKKRLDEQEKKQKELCQAVASVSFDSWDYCCVSLRVRDPICLRDNAHQPLGQAAIGQPSHAAECPRRAACGADRHESDRQS